MLTRRYDNRGVKSRGVVSKWAFCDFRARFSVPPLVSGWVFLVTSVFGLTGLWIAILADTGATVLVTLNALRLLGFNPEKSA